MPTMRVFVDTHDRTTGTFPAELDTRQFAAFFAQFQEACQAEGVTILQIGAGLDDGRAFCMTQAADVDAVRRAHQRVGLPFDTITEVRVATPGSIFLPLMSA